MNKNSKILVLGLVTMGLILYLIFIVLGKRTKPDALSVSNSLKNKAMQHDFLGTNAKFWELNADLNHDGYYDVFAYEPCNVTSKDSIFPLNIKKGVLLQLKDRKYQKLLQIEKDKILGIQNKPIVLQESTPNGYLIRFDTTGKQLIIEIVQSDSLGNPASEPLILEWENDDFQPSY